MLLKENERTLCKKNASMASGFKKKFYMGIQNWALFVCFVRQGLVIFFSLTRF